ncbi:metalloregulator ArsR/SmtB family transcription factor [Bacillus aerolatus]|uniref:Metalloregulator ArsR/SmtB family transcription factor n=1 Tax=Bacillus aerolatus TaxID=2653354 RepID=A0A6I1FFS6_9BACI|nr:metalloregulator ArsR/SmtB family transcription factor [Bacillus aerolatus]KAB7704413.1 metalloregulator ArsR/SmtB family transcription factor [Bacillus aerolatus]
MKVNVKSTVEIETAANILKLLGDKTRLTMMKLLQVNECCVCEFVEIFKISQPAISQHLRKLRDGGLVQETRRGQWIHYSINKESEHYDFVQSLLDYLPGQEKYLEELAAQGLRIICD